MRSGPDLVADHGLADVDLVDVDIGVGLSAPQGDVNGDEPAGCCSSELPSHQGFDRVSMLQRRAPLEVLGNVHSGIGELIYVRWEHGLRLDGLPARGDLEQQERGARCDGSLGRPRKLHCPLALIGSPSGASLRFTSPYARLGGRGEGDGAGVEADVACVVGRAELVARTSYRGSCNLRGEPPLEPPFADYFKGVAWPNPPPIPKSSVHP